jgi:thiamine-monophosphate kinase
MMRAQPVRHAALGPGAEFDRIRNIATLLGNQAGDLGDDCSLVQHGDEFIALSTDVSVEGVHFRLDWITPREAGWRATAAALSDLAAEGAEPIGVLCAVTMPVQSREAELLEVMAGIGDAAAAINSKVLGGDLSSGPNWSIAVTVIGRTRSPVSRSGAKAGDGVWVTGTLGGSRVALETWLNGGEPSPGARSRFAHPEPRIAAGRWLAQHGAWAMIDLSDGLAGDAPHLGAGSSISMIIDLDSIPLAAEVTEEARRLGVSAQRFAAEGGEDYELLVALPGDFDAVDGFVDACGIVLTRVGEAREGTGVRFLSAGREVELHGFDHFG